MHLTPTLQLMEVLRLCHRLFDSLHEHCCKSSQKPRQGTWDQIDTYNPNKHM